MKKLTLFIVLCIGCLACHKKPAPSKPAPKWPDYTKAYNLLQVNKDSAFYYFNKAVNNSRDSLEVAYAYTNMAMLQSDAGDYFGCQESLIQSLRFQDNGQESGRQYLATTYHELGLASFNLGNYAEAIRFYGKALQLSTDSSFRPAILNNQGNAYQKIHRYNEALQLYRMAIKQTGLKPKTYARLLTNIATTQWLCEPQFKAAPALRKALKIRQTEQDQWGQNSSYAHLSDYYARSQPDSALWYARQMYGTAVALRSPDDELEALEKLIKLSPVNAVRSYFLRYQQLNDSLRTARNAARNQFALIRYQSEKQKADNLQLQKDNIVQRYQLTRQRIISGVILMVLVSGSMITAFWLKKRKERLQLQAQKQIQETKLNLSKKVHDVVANRLYSLIMSIEHEQVTNQEQLLPDLEELYQQSRDISYDQPVVTSKPYHQQLSELLGSFRNDRIAVLTTGNYESTWAETGSLLRTHVRYILLELMVNMKKHSRASQVGIRLERLPTTLTVIYTDNGTGLPSDVNFGNGLISTGNRIKELGGSITFGSGRTNGLQVTLVFPIAQP